MFNLGLRFREQGAYFLKYIKTMVQPIKEKTVIETCILRSRQLQKLKKILVKAKDLKTELTSCIVHFTEEEDVIDLIKNVENRIAEFEVSISQSIQPIVQSHGIQLDLRYWFSSDDIRSGYALLRKSNISPRMGATHVLFLKDQTDSFDGSRVKEGEVRAYNHVNHFLERIDVEVELKKQQRKSKAV
jgi:hypothetical protein